MKGRSSFVWYMIVLIIAAFFVFFVQIIPQSDGGRSYALSSRGWESFRKGMDIAWWVRLNYKIDLTKYKQLYTNQQEYTLITRNVKDIILQNIDTRISGLGVSDYESYLQTIGDDEFVVVEIGWVSDLDQAKAIIGKTVELEFKTPYEGDGSDIRTERQLLAEEVLKQAVASPSSLQEIGNSYVGEDVYFARYDNRTIDQLPDIYVANPELLAERSPGAVYPTLVEGLHSVVPPISGFTDIETRVEGRVISRVVSVWTTTGTTAWTGSEAVQQPTYTVEELLVRSTVSRVSAKDPKTNEVLNGAYFKFASVSQSQTGQPVATITFDDKGKDIFCNLTEQIVGKQLAIFVWWELVTAPVIREKICGGSAQIDGQFTPADAKLLVEDLNEGALPAALILSNEEKVSPKLWERAMEGALWAGAIGLALVFVYMTIMYGVRYGFQTMLTLVFFLMVLLAFVKLIGYALSLSGIAALLLSIGMGVDANILIYERVREEQKQGNKWTEAIVQGYARSWSAIKDGNLTTILIGLLLLFVGTNLFKWFWTMMIMTILLTLFVMVPLIKETMLAFEPKNK